MADVDFEFRVFASEETAHWNLSQTPLKGAPVFGLYLICVGEATYLCSITPSSRADFLRNAFLTDHAADPAAAEAYLNSGDHGEEFENGGESVTYFGFIDVDSPTRAPYLSGPITVTLDSDDYEDTEEGRGAMRDDAWREALEEASANHRDPPVVFGGEAYTTHAAAA